LYDAICLGPNIEKHASAPLYAPNETHPHPEYSHLKRLKIGYMNKMMKRLREECFVHRMSEQEVQNQHWLDFCKVADLHYKCPQKVAFEKILGLQQLDQKQQAMSYNACIHSIFAAAKRQMKRAPTPDPKVADDFVEFAKQYIEKNIGPELDDFGYSFQQWYAHNSKKKQQDIDKYLKATKDRASFNKKEYKELMTEKYKGICKIEVQPTDGKPRMVCAIPIKTKVTMGPITWRLEEICSKKLPGYCGNKNLQQMTNEVNKILAEGFTKIVEGDGSGFDNTQDVSLKEVDRYIYRRVLPKVYHVPKTQFYHISQSLYKTMVVQYIQDKKKKTLFEYSILGSVFSGDCDTTLCNTIRMALYNIYVNEKVGLTYGKDFKVFSKGDDFSVFYKPYVPNDLIDKAYYTYFLRGADVTGKPQVYGLGQILKFLTKGNADTLSFCSLRAIYTSLAEDKIILVRDFRKFDNLSLYARKSKAYHGKEKIAYLKQQAISLRAAYGKITIFEQMADAFDTAAEIYARLYTNGDENKAQELVEQSLKIVRKMMIAARQQASEMFDKESEWEMILYGIKHNKQFFKIQDNYWDTIKRLQEKISYNLTLQEYEYVNQQIQMEMDYEYFRSNMGLKNFNHESKKKTQQNKTKHQL
jgi:hypothetical protein